MWVNEHDVVKMNQIAFFSQYCFALLTLYICVCDVICVVF